MKEKQENTEKNNKNPEELEKSKHKSDKKKQKISKDDKINELTDSLQRLQAEFENYKKRVDKEKQELSNYSKADIIVKILPILDSIELALKNECRKDEFYKGIEMIFAQVYSTLKNEGLRPIDAVGKPFDPYLHEVLLKEESDKEEDTIIEELQKGYMLNEMVLRPSKVKVSKKEKTSQEKEEHQDK